MISETNPAENSAIRKVSIVIPTHDRASSLKVTLNALNSLLVPDEATLQVVIVMDGCSDNTADVIDHWRVDFQHQVVTVSTSGLGAAGARNAGVAKADGILIAFMDDDIIPHPTWLEVHFRSHQCSNAPLVSIGAISLPRDKRLPPWNEWEVLSLQRRYQELASGDTQAGPADLYTGNVMIPRRALVKINGFDESLRRAEDVDLGLRLAEEGLNFKFLAEADVAHYSIRTLQSWKNVPIAYAKSHFEMRDERNGDDMTQIGSPQLRDMHVITKLAVRLFARNESVSTVYCTIAQALGSLAYLARLRSVSYAAFSSVYNVLYFGTLHRIQAQHAHNEISGHG